jgi:lipoprotein-anchoring transpeptidase ErfK/SrfK
MSSKLRCVVGDGSSQPAWVVRQTLMRGAAVVLLAGAVPIGLTSRAQAQFPFYQGYGYKTDVNPNPSPRPKPRSSAKNEHSAKAEPAFGAMPKGPLQIVVSIGSQRVTLYSGGVHVAQGPVSTGIPGKPTPMGVFSIIEKDRYHHSNLYSNAPMPYMERITWSGVALHEGPLPGYPASHGCIRMTHDFAARLWVVAKLGVRVVVARNDPVPTEFSDPHLFVPKAKPAAPAEAGNEPAQRSGSLDPVKVAQAAANTGNDAQGVAVPALPANELRGPVAPAGEPAVGVPSTSVGATPDAGATPAAPAAAAPAPVVTEVKSDAADPPKPAPDAADPPKSAPTPPSPRNRAAAAAQQPPKQSGEVAVFISRKEKKLFVRQGFVPLFDVPVTIENPDQPLGTHVFTAMAYTSDGAAMRWNVMSMPAEPARALAPKIRSKKEKAPPAKSAEFYPPQTPAQALDRIQIPQEAMDRIGEIMGPGTSLVISDEGLGRETGRGTDFIVLTR